MRMKSFLGQPSLPFAISLALAAVLVGTGWSVARGEEPEKPPAVPVALKGLDPVLLIQGKETRGQAEMSVTRNGFRYLFAEAANKAKFEKEPARYAIQFRGQCAMMKGARARPDLFTVYKGRIYAFGSEGCQQAFL
jgi:YHS domain-containing protein